jgi:hypothetical protein
MIMHIFYLTFNFDIISNLQNKSKNSPRSSISPSCGFTAISSGSSPPSPPYGHVYTHIALFWTQPSTPGCLYRFLNNKAFKHNHRTSLKIRKLSLVHYYLICSSFKFTNCLSHYFFPDATNTQTKIEVYGHIALQAPLLWNGFSVCHCLSSC